MATLSQQPRSLPWLLALLVPLAVLGRYSTLVLSRSSEHLNAMAEELGGVREFFAKPVPKHGSDVLFFSETADDGIAAYIRDGSNGGKTLLYTQKQGKLSGLGLGGWSPDDGLFAYSRRSPDSEIVISDGKSTNDAVATVQASQIIGELTWLSPQSLVCLDVKNDFHLIKNSDGKWTSSPLFKKRSQPAKQAGTPASRVPAAAMKGLLATSGNSVAWQQGGDIWSYQLGAEAPERIWESTNFSLLEFSFSEGQNRLLLHGRDRRGEFIADGDPASGSIGTPDRIQKSGVSFATNLVCINGGLGYAYVVHGTGSDTVVIKPTRDAAPIQLPWRSVAFLTANDTAVYVTGEEINEPPAIWRYNVSDQTLNSEVSSMDRPFRYAKNVTALHGVVTNAQGVTVDYYLCPPVNFSPARKYGLLFAFSANQWRPNQEAVPNAGAYFAYLQQTTSRNQVADTLAVMDTLVQNPNVDTNRLYISGNSAAASTAVQLLVLRPDLWRGAVLWSALSFPDVYRIRASRILMDSGSDDAYLAKEGGVKKLTEFQDAAARAGVSVTLAVHAGAPHIYRSTTLETERIKEMLDYLFGAGKND